MGKSLPEVIRKGTGILEHMEGLFDFYDEGLGLDTANRYLARMAAQIGHRYPQMKVFEIGTVYLGPSLLLRCLLREIQARGQEGLHELYCPISAICFLVILILTFQADSSMLPKSVSRNSRAV